VFARQAALVKAGIPVTMRLDYLKGRIWKGQIDYVYPSLNPVTRTLRVRLRFDNIDKMLKPNMFVEITIHIDSPETFLLVPKTAVIRTGDKNVVVLALGEGRYKSVAVEIAGSDNEFLSISKGLKLGDEVVVSAQFLLDSESSKNSDFKRMHNQFEADETLPSTPPNSSPTTTQTHQFH
jgi:Cu(I)/Ag(I) efflux system membrane fusion protein